jgi:CubicO group peptidase (beta-lactamase class C family)
MKKLLAFLWFFSALLLAHAQSFRDTTVLRSFLDGVITAKMHDQHVAGATVAVVHDGKLLFSKGYGFSDVATQTPVFPDSTLFRVGSVSKLFVWTSVMQLAAQGKLDLQADVNQYLKDFQIPATFEKPITLAHLLTHTPGFEDIVLNLFARDSAALKPLGEILKKEMPGRVREPGTFASYSNHGTALAAHIVELVSGLSFHEYVEKNIFGPLNLTRTTFRQPVPKKFPAHAATGYVYRDGRYVAQAFEYVPLYAAGSVSSTATDMATFMMALLQHQSAILDSATHARMMQPLHRHHPAVNPMRHGLMDLSQNGQEIIGHGGDTFWFHSLFMLMPRHQLGLFISLNSENGGKVYGEVAEEFVDYFFPDTTLAKPIDMPLDQLQRFAGTYVANRHPHRDLTKISSLFGMVKVSVADSARLRVIANDEVTFYVPIDSTVFREEGSSDVIAFSTTDGQHLFIGGLPIFVLDRASGWSSPDTQMPLAILVLIIAIVVILFWPLAYLTRTGYQALQRQRLLLPSSTKVIAWLNYAFLLAFVIGLANSVADASGIVFGVPGGLKVALLFPLLAITTTILMIFACTRLVANSRYLVWSRIFYLLITAVSVVALLQLNTWNFIGFRY